MADSVRSARSQLENSIARALADFTSGSDAVHAAGAGCDGPQCPGTSSNTQQSSTSTTSQNRNIRTSQSPSLDALRGFVTDDVGEEAALHLDTNLEEISIDSVLADVDSDPVCGRPTCTCRGGSMGRL